MNDNGHSYCYSTLTITPGEIHKDTSMLIPCTSPSANSSMNFSEITCEVNTESQTNAESLPFKIAGKLYNYELIATIIYSNYYSDNVFNVYIITYNVYTECM